MWLAERSVSEVSWGWSFRGGAVRARRDTAGTVEGAHDDVEAEFEG